MKNKNIWKYGIAVFAVALVIAAVVFSNPKLYKDSLGGLGGVSSSAPEQQECLAYDVTCWEERVRVSQEYVDTLREDVAKLENAFTQAMARADAKRQEIAAARQAVEQAQADVTAKSRLLTAANNTLRTVQAAYARNRTRANQEAVLRAEAAVATARRNLTLAQTRLAEARRGVDKLVAELRTINDDIAAINQEQTAARQNLQNAEEALQALQTGLQNARAAWDAIIREACFAWKQWALDGRISPNAPSQDFYMMDACGMKYPAVMAADYSRCKEIRASELFVGKAPAWAEGFLDDACREVFPVLMNVKVDIGSCRQLRQWELEGTLTANAVRNDLSDAMALCQMLDADLMGLTMEGCASTRRWELEGRLSPGDSYRVENCRALFPDTMNSQEEQEQPSLQEGTSS